MTQGPNLASVPRMMTRLGLLLAATMLLLAADPVVAATPSDTYAAKIVSATNKVRLNHDRPALRGNRCVRRFAARQARRMAAQERQFHQRLGPILRECHLTKVGENVGYGFPTGTAIVLLGWVLSPPHLANILDREYGLLGAAARKGDNGVWYASQVFGRR